MESPGDHKQAQSHRLPFPEPVEPRRKAQWATSAFDHAGVWRLSASIPAVLAQVFRMAWRIDRRDVIVMVGAQLTYGICSAVALTATSRAMTHILGTGTVAGRVHAALPALLAIAVAAGIGRVAHGLASWSVGRLRPRLMTAADIAVVDAMVSVELAAFNEPGFAEEHEAAEAGSLRCDRLIYDVQSFMSALIKLVAAFGVLTVLHPLMLPVLVLAVAPSGTGAMAEARIEHRTHHANSSGRNVKGMMRWYLTTTQLADEVRGNSMAPYLMFWYRTITGRMDARSLTGAARALRINLLSACAGGVCLTLAWATLAWLTITGRMSLAIAATAVLAVRAALGNLTNAVHYAASLFHSSLFLGDWKRFITSSREHYPSHGTVVVPDRPETIRVEDVSFTYPNKTRPAVDGVSLTLRRGQVVAVLGENGSGKSTLTRLLCGLYTADKGRVLWDGADLAEMDLRRVWEHTGVVTQQFGYWPLSARENITLGQPVTSGDDRVWKVVDAVGMREAAEELPDGLDTLLARELWGGVSLSGGQWQRVACGRVLYREPDVVVLDEPTSQMDAQGEHDMFRLVRTIAPDRITVVVTHRPANARVADLIVVMDQGHIVEQGTFAELVTAGGRFQRWYELGQQA
ncbi:MULTISPECIES: ABC transporter ATP-binding protein [Streptomyces]|uniref:ABC transporter ATP-binding protein n=2 Tax=Streptomyces TaxID=1883 RepID=A0A3Q9FTN1_STRLT|nr:ABC transporter ATP-binding protein [Streptomyces luteoverticillatus]